MSRSVKKGFDHHLAKIAKRDRVFDESQEYPMVFRGHTFHTVDEYRAWHERMWRDGSYGSTIGVAHAPTPKGYDSWREIGGPKGKSKAKAHTARSIRRAVRSNIHNHDE